MASHGNLNQPGGGHFDAHNLFRPTGPSPLPQTVSTPVSQEIINNDGAISNSPLISSFQHPSASYPPPTVAGGGVGPYSYLPQTMPFQHHQQFVNRPIYRLPSHPQDFTNVHPQRSIAYPTPTLQPQVSATSSPQISNFSNPNYHGARLMALLSTPPTNIEIPQQPSVPTPQMPLVSSSSSEFSVTQNVNILPQSPGLSISNQGPVMQMTSSKQPKGRHLVGDYLAYDIDVRLPGEVQPQLEVTPITKYGSDPGLVIGRQIAVNKSYICYGLKLGAIRVLNINTASRSLLKGLAQRVTDMAFFAEDVHLLASASVDGRVYVWKIAEESDEEDKLQITGTIVFAIQFTGVGESVHPKVCWHCHKQEVLVVGIGRHVLKIDTTKLRKGEKFSAEEPLKCPFDELIDGVQLVGSHDGEVTDLSMCQWMMTRLASASVDGTIKIWEDRKPLPVAVLQPYGGDPVYSINFLAAPHRPDHIILITGGPLNREIKIWVAASEEGWLLTSDSESWHCRQTLELKSLKAQAEDAFFNQVLGLPQAGLLLLANAKRNAIYVVHLDYGLNPAATRMDYIAEFTVTMRVLSFTGTSESLPNGEQIVQVYCVQLQAIQQYALDLSQCLPPQMGDVVNEKSDSGALHDSFSIGELSRLDSSVVNSVEETTFSAASKAAVSESMPKSTSAAMHPVNPHEEPPKLQEVTSNMENEPILTSRDSNEGNLLSISSPSLQFSPKLSKSNPNFKSPSSSFEHVHLVSNLGDESKVAEYSVDRQMDAIQRNQSDVSTNDDETKNYGHAQEDNATVLNHSNNFRHPTHLITPSEILMATSADSVSTTVSKSEAEVKIQDVVMRNDVENDDLDVKVVGETTFIQNNDSWSCEELPSFVSEDMEKTFNSQISELGIDMAQKCHVGCSETYVMEEDGLPDGNGGTETVIQHSTLEMESYDQANDASEVVTDSSARPLAQQPASNSKEKKHKGKCAEDSSQHSPSPSGAFNSTSNDRVISYITSLESQMSSMQSILNQIMSVQMEMQKQLTTVAAIPITEEGKRLETALGRNLEKMVKVHADALWVRFQEESVKQEKASRDRIQNVSNMISSCLNKDLPAILEKTVKRELNSIGQSVARTILPTIEKSISNSIAESFQKGVGDKAVAQLEKLVNSKLEATLARQIQLQFQTSVKQVLQDTLKSTLEVSVIPAFDSSCHAMFEQVDAAFHKGMAEHTSLSQQQFEASHSSLALALRDAINSASSMTQTLSNELLGGQRKLLELAISGPDSKSANPLINQLTNGPLSGLHEKLEMHVDPRKELSRLLTEHKYEEAFTTALQRSDVTIVSWLCSQVDLPTILLMNPLPLSQGVLLSLLQQLACDIGTDTSRKLTWMRDIVTAINPSDSVIVVHVRPIFEQVYQILNHHRTIPTISGSDLSNTRLIMHVLNSMLMTLK